MTNTKPRILVVSDSPTRELSGELVRMAAVTRGVDAEVQVVSWDEVILPEDVQDVVAFMPEIGVKPERLEVLNREHIRLVIVAVFHPSVPPDLSWLRANYRLVRSCARNVTPADYVKGLLPETQAA